LYDKAKVVVGDTHAAGAGAGVGAGV